MSIITIENLIHDLIIEVVKANDDIVDPNDLADLVLDQLNISELRDYSRQPIVDKIKYLRRNINWTEKRLDSISIARNGDLSQTDRRVRVRLSEKEMLVDLKRASTDVERIACYRRLEDLEFKIEDGREVRWGDATVEDHRSRLRILYPRLGGLQETISLHEEAIRLIQITPGVTTLREIGKANNGTVSS